MWNCTFPCFTVMIETGEKPFEFREHDFDSVDLEDFRVVMRDLRTWEVKQKEVIYGLESVKRYIRHATVRACIEDFQLAFEGQHEKVNLKSPDFRIPNLEGLIVFDVRTRPDFGITYQDGQGVSRFMRFSQIACFCDSTLLHIRKLLKERVACCRDFSEDRFGMNKSWVEKAFGCINERLNYRLKMRRVESAMRLRKRTVETWD